MTISKNINKVEIPNISDILKSGKKAKNEIDNSNLNTVNIHFLYSDGRFKRTVTGTLIHIAEIPMVFIEYPSKLGFLVLNDSLIFDITTQSFELFINENFTHTINLKDLKTLDIDKKISDLIENIKFIVPISVSQFNCKKIKVKEFTDSTGKEINLLPSFLSSLGRAKLLENTTESSNDGLIIALVIGGLVGFIAGIITTALTIL
jgi:hypothetical protein